MLPGSKTRQIRRSLLRWYDKTRRDLPWRHTHDPYSIWIAETMLQQTQVKTVLPYYNRFLSAYPTLKSLDRAPKVKVLALWSGLGYYRRAENLKKAARTVARKHAGRLPQDIQTLLQLPGIGLYTAGALMSIAFNRPYPALDGNSRRVLSRLYNLTKERELNETAKRLVSNSRPGHWNQALMELGAQVCVTNNPTCPSCPLTLLCRASHTGQFRSLQRTTLRKPEAVTWPLMIIEKNGRILLHRRAQGGLLGGTWEVPGGQIKGRENAKAALTRHLSCIGQQRYSSSKVGEIHHSITHHRIRSPVFIHSGSQGIRLPDSSWRWIPMGSIHRYPVSSLTIKAVRLFAIREKNANQIKLFHK